MRHWLVNTGESVPCEHEYVRHIYEHPEHFGLSVSELELARRNWDGLDAMIDKVLFQGWIVIHPDPGDLAVLCCIMWEEWPDLGRPTGLAEWHGWRLLERWIAAQGLSPAVRIRVKIRKTGQSWEQTAQATLLGYQYSRGVGKQFCPRCNGSVSNEELLVNRRCPRCGAWLA